MAPPPGASKVARTAPDGDSPKCRCKPLSGEVWLGEKVSVKAGRQVDDVMNAVYKVNLSVLILVEVDY